MQITKADPSDHKSLTHVMQKSKAHWGYSKEQMKKWEKELTIRPEDFEANKIFKLINNDQSIIGFYSFKNKNNNSVHLNDLFILPDHIGKGLGKLLLNDFINKIKNANASKITLESDPNAEGFYLHYGFKTVGQRETSIKGRYLPIMEKTIIGC